MFYRKIILFFNLFLIFLFFFLLGRFSYSYQIMKNRPEIEAIPEINQKVPVIDIEEFCGAIKGRVGDKKVRIRYKGQLVEVLENGEFEVEEDCGMG